MAPIPAEVDMHSVFASKQNDRMIEIYIGTDPNPLKMPESVLLRTSDYFRGLLQRGFKESDGVIHKPDDDVTAWKILTFWMTERGLPPYEDCDDADLLKAWYLADYMSITQLQDDIMFSLLLHALAAVDTAEKYMELLRHTRAGALPRKCTRRC
ncbi:hypothetical protein CLAFUW4_04032 [Fulvia fulva]|uniref:BTB domain-containing protein n=1 Tax=Passalora fulva TaxID=5499 RepID=A0A9Q8LFG8_PASFU|nr:uncharacterized protein CLAFUR5_03997 [Fulvia fulva]KAK4627125.1 hypothetical protein CLAFUR4_04018 [Fulvia fulva]KAK4627604.1 hypothetical protein CLAFUR0_04019 [Fulvia fulva]UJO16435.1 hypothetical protein CLAFUR5_03997 [Fulvia fulva]WPV14286.1 hypothetical protein CLAFUW4_04032 [Fulvia fulva]WPV29210.1 hypothetical protein CLAFUW7_04021 [Fulvia fulva]